MSTYTMSNTLYRNTYHRNGTVTYWDVYEQQWRRTAASRIPDHILASMTDSERARIARIVERA